MAEPRRFLDVWIVEVNKVYKEVPFNVVSDWLQQGRLLEDDRVKPSGTSHWVRAGDYPDLAPYLLRPEPFRAEDKAEALEAVEIDFQYRKHHDEEEGDVDMIPLIDVSLVLLIFFMLTASAGGMAAFVPTPDTDSGQIVTAPEGLRIDIDRDPDGNPVYSLGEGQDPARKEDSKLTMPEVLEHLKARLARMPGQTELVINAHKDLKARYPRDLLLALDKDPYRAKITLNFFGVSEKAP